MNAAKPHQGRFIAELGHVLAGKMPFFGTRRFDVHISARSRISSPTCAARTRRSSSARSVRSAPSSTDFAHRTHLNSWYNCFKVDENAMRSGFAKLGVHNVGSLFTRVLIDVAGFKASRC